MKTAKIDDMTRGWFVGNFAPTLYNTNACEVAVKTYKKGEREQRHFHKIATEITVIISGKVKMFDKVFSDGDIIIVEPGDETAFEALENATNVVVKIPGVSNDKYLVEDNINA